ncbi:hypothetical protein KP509_09G054900 [Ceratopteris richardii]|uniref:Bifunctional inhibitor/plant lipid transfer protein/seed storage helical domain-containing protein n=1 Tax=Ceratopteris richardii TaxID=49495 RepID=A0A8T2U4B1_CERRI|nr:hypothetical protein KP509_09G054900 [Ceratopteris richardii]
MQGSREGRSRWSVAAMAALTTTMVMILAMAGVDGACPSQGQLASACAQYVLGNNPPPPPPFGGCCRLLKASGRSCLCSAIPSNARNLVNPQSLKNIRSSCRITFNSPGF